MNTLDGMLADLERDDTHIGGCTTAGEVVIMLKQLRDDTIVIPAGVTNGDVIKALFPNAKYEHVKTLSGVDFVRVKGLDAFGLEQHFHDEWWNAPYKREGDNE